MTIREPWRTPDAPTGRFYNAPSGQGRYPYLVAVLLGAILVVLCMLAFFLGRAILSDSQVTGGSGVASPVPAVVLTDQALPSGTTSFQQGQSRIAIEPVQGYIGTLITVTGWGWWPGEPVFVFLRSSSESQAAAYAYAAAVSDDQGGFQTAFTFPNEMRWIGAEWAEVVARGSRSGLEASTRFVLVPPTPTATVPLPTPLPTLPPTATSTAQAPTATPLATATASPVAITDWRGEYFDNPTLAGNPALTRNDIAIDFVWGSSAPGAGVPADRFSTRWSRQQRFRAGIYRFTLSMDDGARFWINGQLVVDDWQDGPFRSHTVELSVPEGVHALQLEYYENLGEAAVRLGWERIEAPAVSPTPTPSSTSTPSPTSPPPISEPWQASYYDNPELAGEPVLVRQDAELSFDWGAGSPGNEVPADSFSARWTRNLWMPAGKVRILLEVDDGARVWVDGELLIDAWQIATGQTYSAEVELSEGIHRIVVEYFEAFLDAHIRLWLEGP